VNCMVELVTVGAVVGGILLFLIVGDFAFKRVCGVPEPSDEEHTVTTGDGVELALWRHTPKNAVGDGGKPEGEGGETGGNGEPVLLVHGIAVGHRNMNFDDENGVAQYLAEQGYDCWCVDLRGRGGSDVPGSSWSYDDYVEEDLPATIDYVLEETGADGLHWVGHSQGGSLFYAAVGSQGYDDKVKSAVTIGAPVYFYNQPFLHYISRLGVSTAIAPFLRRMKRLHLLPYTARLASVFLPVWPNGIVIWLANKRNVDNRTLRRATPCVVARLCPRVLHNYADWIVHGRWTSEDGETDYHDAARSVETPTLVIAGDSDTLCPRRNVKPGYRMVDTDDKEYLVAGEDIGSKDDYAHADLVFGRNAKEDVFPEVNRWLDEYGG